MKNRLFFFVFLLGLFLGTHVLAMTSTNFQIPWDSMNSGGDDISSSTNFRVRDTIGDNASGTSTSSNFQLSAGYRAPEGANILQSVIRAETASTETGYSFFSSTSTSVSVSSTAAFSVDNYIGVVQNRGFSQLIAVGKISSVSGTVLTVDSFDGDTSSMSTTTGGGDDFVYRLDSNSVAFGTVTAGTDKVAVALASSLTNVSTGFSMYLQANQELQKSVSDIIDAVVDGTVTSGVEEYGVEQVGSTAVSAGTDLGVTTTQRAIQTNGASSGSVADRVAMSFKLSITSATPEGSYSQSVFYTLTANY